MLSPVFAGLSFSSPFPAFHHNNHAVFFPEVDLTLLQQAQASAWIAPISTQCAVLVHGNAHRASPVSAHMPDSYGHPHPSCRNATRSSSRSSSATPS